MFPKSLSQTMAGLETDHAREKIRTIEGMGIWENLRSAVFGGAKMVEKGEVMAKHKIRPHAREWGTELKVLRARAGRTQKSLAAPLNCSDTLISGFESGTHWPSREMAVELDDLVAGEGALVRLWDRLNSKKSYPDWVVDLVKAEPRATVMREFETTVVPGLIQIEAYARTLIAANNGLAPQRDIEELVFGRMERQKLWDLPDPPRLVLVMNEAVLTASIGGPQVMFEQITKLIDMVESRKVRVHVIPLETHGPPAVMPFTVFSFEDQEDTLYLEDGLSGRMVTDQDDVSRMDRIFSDLLGVALSPEKSLKALYQHRRKHDDEALT